MYVKIKVSHLFISLVLLSTLLLGGIALAGSPDPGGAPDSTTSFSLEDLYNRLASGTAGTQRAFTEPDVGPGTATMHTLNEIMAVAPAPDNTDGAAPAQVASGATYWGLRDDAWGLQTGTAVLAGGDATDADVLSGVTYSNDTGLSTGTMPDRGAVVMVPTTMSQTIAMGYHDGGGAVQGDADLLPGNIRSGVKIFGVTGTCYRLPQTGQTTMYWVGDDGAYQLGCLPSVVPSGGPDGGNFNRTQLPWASDSGTGFTDNGDGTVTDNLTGLTWLKNANCFERMDWDAAVRVADILASGICGLTDGSSPGDWRLPNINELRSLIDPDQTGPALPSGHPFTGVPAEPNGYWSSSSSDIANGWWVSLEEGYTNISLKPNLHYVWPVRGGQ